MKLGRRSFLGFLAAAPFAGKALEAAPPVAKPVGAQLAEAGAYGLAPVKAEAAAIDYGTSRFMHVAYSQGFIVTSDA